MTNVDILPLTKDRAEAECERIAELLNRIPLLDYTNEDVLSEVSYRGKPLTGKWDQSLIAVAGDQIVAVLIAHQKQADPPWYPEDSCYLSEVVTDSEWEGRGIARQLTERWLASTAHLAPHSLQTNSRAENQPVIDFYKRMGFEEVARKEYDNRIDMMMYRYS